MSIEFEWPIYEFGRVKVNISVTQIGANISNDKRHRLVIPFGRHTNNKKFLIRLQIFLARVDVAFIGRMIANDIAKLKKDYQSVSFSISNVVDIGTTAIYRDLATKKRGTTTLQALVAKLGYHLPKTDEIRRSSVFDIETPYLSKDTQVYCEKDVEEWLLAYADDQKRTNLALRIKTEEIKVGK